ncbi:hypothetical protein PCASD_17508 [Puccinia coronata f. sp. avenae]|uniref:Hydrophobin n=1 Tax=Puccinia coronata f. sp. avenae TaxID=200324 RepID=A0A2N5T3T6_9BASI|nr:hypothetical protein PCASD_17508 [Puccinia coronata f. sp. avenae]
MTPHFSKVLQITLVVLLLQLVAESAAGFKCPVKAGDVHTTGLCAIKKGAGVTQCPNGTPKCCAKGTKNNTKVATEAALNAICPSESAPPGGAPIVFTATGGGTTATGGGTTATGGGTTATGGGTTATGGGAGANNSTGAGTGTGRP